MCLLLIVLLDGLNLFDGSHQSVVILIFFVRLCRRRRRGVVCGDGYSIAPIFF